MAFRERREAITTLRGLLFHGHFAILGRSKSRENRTFFTLKLDQNLKASDAEARIIEHNSSDVVHWVHIDGVARWSPHIHTIHNRAAQANSYRDFILTQHTAC